MTTRHSTKRSSEPPTSPGSTGDAPGRRCRWRRSPSGRLLSLSTDPGITGAIVEAEDGLDYLGQVIDEYEDRFGRAIPADAFAATNHVLRADAPALDEFEQGLVDMRRLLADQGLRDRDMILTEYGVPTRGSSAEEIEWFLQASTRIVAISAHQAIGHSDDGKLIQRYAWFTARPLGLVDKLRSLGLEAIFLQLSQTSLSGGDGSLTHLGYVYGASLGAEGR